MSTFNGIVAEIPDIRIDYFRLGQHAQGVKACFLSHVHSDHLAGLDSLRSLFVYCSAATKELLLRLERYQDRINFSKGILESRRITYDKRFKGLLRSIPLNVPTEIELSHIRKIRVTLLPANHCPGAVMFLIESDSTAILYTGDIRAEPWWVNMIASSPALIPYSTGIRTLEKIYLDTTNAYNSNTQKKYLTKAKGIKELIQKISKYPADTIFHINSWTLGYEDVFLALSTALGSKVHVDEYKMRLYKGLAQCTDPIPPEESLALCGFNFGNGRQEGCLTSDSNTRLHSCELGSDCSTVESSKTVFVTPVVTRTNDGFEIRELGAATGTGDLDCAHEIDLSNAEGTQSLLQLCVENLDDVGVRDKVVKFILKAASSGKKTLSIPSTDLPEDLNELSLTQVLNLILRAAEVKDSASQSAQNQHELEIDPIDGRPKQRHLTYSYSRHSSYQELCHFLSTFRPKDVFPCVVDESSWTPDKSIKVLFGSYCTGDQFSHDITMSERYSKEDYATKKNGTSSDPIHDESGKDSQSSVTYDISSLPPRSSASPAPPLPPPPSSPPTLEYHPPSPTPYLSPPPAHSQDHPTTPAQDPPRSATPSTASILSVQFMHSPRSHHPLQPSRSSSPSSSIPDEFEEDAAELTPTESGLKRKRTEAEERSVEARREAYEAALNPDGTKWKRLRLMGFRGYEVEEEV